MKEMKTTSTEPIEKIRNTLRSQQSEKGVFCGRNTGAYKRRPEADQEN
jgi:hypothetical protein